MVWHVYWFNPNSHKIETRNVFNLSIRFNDELDRLREEHIKDFYTFSEELRHVVMCCFWSKCEYEIVISPWVSNGEPQKIDVYDQLRLNWETFAAYTWARLYDER